jgi:hypothetical protein
MKPKQKAQELFDKMCSNDGDEYHHCTYYVAKACALIAVDEMLNYFSKETFMMAYPEIAITEVQYWQEVKKEIEAL